MFLPTAAGQSEPAWNTPAVLAAQTTGAASREPGPKGDRATTITYLLRRTGTNITRFQMCESYNTLLYTEKEAAHTAQP